MYFTMTVSATREVNYRHARAPRPRCLTDQARYLAKVPTKVPRAQSRYLVSSINHNSRTTKAFVASYAHGLRTNRCNTQPNRCFSLSSEIPPLVLDGQARFINTSNGDLSRWHRMVVSVSKTQLQTNDQHLTRRLVYLATHPRSGRHTIPQLQQIKHTTLPYKHT